MDAGTLVRTPDALDDQIGREASGLVGALGTGSWVAAALAVASLAALLVKKFGIGVKKVEKPSPVVPDQDADRAADEARARLKMGAKDE